MHWDQVKGNMKQVGGRIKQKWAKLTDDDLLLLDGKKEVFLGKLQERTGLAKEDAERQFDSFIHSIDASKFDTAKPEATKPKAESPRR